MLLWWFSAPSRLKRPVLELLQSEDTDLYVSAASWWELSIKHALGRVRFDAVAVAGLMDRARIQRLAVNFEHAEAAASLPLLHHDPFDRMLIAQAMLENLAIATHDKAFDGYGATILRT